MSEVKRRLIATLLVESGRVVQTKKFRPTNMVGNPFTAVDFFNGWTVDEIAILEISKNEDYLELFFELIDELSRRCFVPLTVGGKIRNLDHVKRLTRAGADKVVLNTGAVETPELITETARNFGSQCVVLSLDAAPNPSLASGYEVMVGNGKVATGLDALDWAKQAVDFGAGELLVNSTEHDGDRRGYDLHLVRMMSDNLTVPIIAMGGVGKWAHMAAGITEGHADAVAAGNIFHYTEHSTKKAKEYLIDCGLPVRSTAFYSVNMPRRPKYRPFG